MTDKSIKFDVDEQGIATLTIDLPGRSMNVFTEQAIRELQGLIEKVGADEKIKGAVVTSGKPAFLAGADLAMLASLSKKGKISACRRCF